MVPSLSDRAKSFIAYSAVLVVAVCNIVFGLNWVAATGPQTRPAATIPGSAPIAISPAAQAPADGAQMRGFVAPAPAKPPLAKAAAEAEQPKCDVNACTKAYRTFRASDCTYMPSSGQRRLCKKGKPPQ